MAFVILLNPKAIAAEAQTIMVVKADYLEVIF
jgi:hypothetical protein